MQRFKRLGTITAVTLALTVGGSTAAQASTWATSSGPFTVSSDGVTRGGGYGSITSPDQHSLRSTTYLADFRSDGMRTYVHFRFYPIGLPGDVPVESGRRSDGGTSYALMQDKLSLYRVDPQTVSQYGFAVNLCMDKSFASDPCRGEVRHNGL